MSAIAQARRLPPPPPEVPVCRSRFGVAPRFLERLDILVVRMDARGHPTLIYETTRTDERQRYLYGFGRYYDDGRGIVTQSRSAEHTWHSDHFGLAADLVHAKLHWDAPAEFWRALEEEAEKLGLTSGADWDRNDATRERFKDLPHVQWGPPMRRSPSPHASELFDAGGLTAVWREVGAL